MIIAEGPKMRRGLAMIGLAVLAFWGPAHAAQEAGTSITLKASYFFPSDSVFRQVYYSGPFFGADIAVPISGPLRLWAGAEIFSQTGQLSLTEEATKVRIVPLFAGLRVELDRSKLQPYIGAAAAYFFLHEENPLGTASEGGFGLISQAGVQSRLSRALRLDIFAGFRVCTVHAAGDDSLSANIGGFSFGLGLTYHF
jgi:hypothetical protein